MGKLKTQMENKLADNIAKYINKKHGPFIEEIKRMGFVYDCVDTVDESMLFDYTPEDGANIYVTLFTDDERPFNVAVFYEFDPLYLEDDDNFSTPEEALERIKDYMAITIKETKYVVTLGEFSSEKQPTKEDLERHLQKIGCYCRVDFQY